MISHPRRRVGRREAAWRSERAPARPAWRILACAAAVLVTAGCSDGSTGPSSTSADLHARALAAGLAPMPTEPLRPLDNPYRAGNVALGHHLFFDPILSGPRDVACSTCHLPRFAFADGRQFPAGAGATGLGPQRTDPGPWPMRPMPRNSPPVFNVGLYGRFGTAPSVNGMIFWGGNAFGLEDQVLAPIAADNELRGVAYPKALAIDSVIGRLRSIPEYVTMFSEAFPKIVPAAPERLITATTVRRALAGYIRELVTPHAPLDAFLRGDEGALSTEQKAGLELFIGKAGCVRCHSGPTLSDFDLHVLGTLQVGLGRDTTPGDDLGWGEHGGKPYAFRTAPLRQVALTAPYFHAGSAETLDDVLEFKNAGISAHPRVSADQLDPAIHPLGLSSSELVQLRAFLHALTDTISVKGPLFDAPAGVPSGLVIPQ